MASVRQEPPLSHVILNDVANEFSRLLAEGTSKAVGGGVVGMVLEGLWRVCGGFAELVEALWGGGSTQKLNMRQEHLGSRSTSYRRTS